jgi:hypothetical protein
MAATNAIIAIIDHLFAKLIVQPIIGTRFGGNNLLSSLLK